VKSPHIVLLVLDTQRADRLSCYGCPLPTSPNLDRLATDSTRYTRAVAPAQWTVPSHASMFTGRYPSEHTVLQLEYVLPAGLPTLAERLARAGYYTAGFSNNSMIGILKNGLGRGFNHFINYASAEYRSGQNSEANGRATEVDGTPGSFGRIRQAWQRGMGRAMAAAERFFVGSELARKIAGQPWVWNLLAPIFWHDEKVKGNTVQSLADAAEMLINRPGAAAEQPMFVFINLMGTHWPYDPPDWAVERFLPELAGQDIQAFVRRSNDEAKKWPEVWTTPVPAEKVRIMDGLYNAEVLGQDAALGEFFERLQTAGVLDETFLMVVADHGEQLGEKGLVGHAYGVYEPVLHVPLLIRDPQRRFAPGAVSDELISIRRLFHTALEAAGAATAEEQAMSLSQGAAGDEPVFAEAWPPDRPYIRQQQRDELERAGYAVPHYAAYDGSGHKLIEAGGACLGLFVPAEDRNEGNDLQAQQPAKVERLQGKVAEYRQQGGAAPAERMVIEDPVLMERLKALGYVE
jgi:arylsulfatase A-like enzyme